MDYLPAQGLYDPANEKDACGVGFICHIKGKPSHGIVSDALQMLENMNHRGACGCEENSGDGAGILIQTPDSFFRREAAKLGTTLPEAGQYGVGMGLSAARCGDAARVRNASSSASPNRTA